MRAVAAAAVLLAGLLLAPAARAEEDLQKVPSCPHCGMSREKFAQSRMVVEYEDGSSVGTCSLHCAAVDLAVAIDKAPRALRVADASTKKLLDAEKAFWVVGGSRPGVMTRRGKWAFETREAAEAFAKENGGALAAFEEAMKATYEDMYADTKMIREKRKAMRAKAQEMKH
jgi:hypothetical protein